MTDDDIGAFAKLLKDARGDVQLTTMAKDFGCTPQYWSDLERGRRGPNPDLVRKLGVYFGHKPEERTRWHTICARQMGWDI